MTRTEKAKMLAGEPSDASAPEIQADLQATHRSLARYKASLGMSASERRALLLQRLAAVGEGAVIRPPFHCDYGFNIRRGAGTFVNFNCVVLDVVEVAHHCDRTQIGPGVQLLATDHPATRRGEPPAWNSGARSASGATSGSGGDHSAGRLRRRRRADRRG